MVEDDEFCVENPLIRLCQHTEVQQIVRKRDFGLAIVDLADRVALSRDLALDTRGQEALPASSGARFSLHTFEVRRAGHYLPGRKLDGNSTF